MHASALSVRAERKRAHCGQVVVGGEKRGSLFGEFKTLQSNFTQKVYWKERKKRVSGGISICAGLLQGLACLSNFK